MSGIKFDGGKPRMSLLPIKQLWAVISVLEYGAKKYSGTEILSDEIIENLVLEQLCQKQQIAPDAEIKNVSLLRDFAPPVTAYQLCASLLASVVTKSDSSDLNHKFAVVVMKPDACPGELKRQLEKLITKKHIAANPDLEKGKKKEMQGGENAPNTLARSGETHSCEISQSMELPKKNITVVWKGDAKSAEALSDHTLTMTIELGDLEVCFVANATKALDCYRMILTLCNAFWDTSLSISEISKSISGEGNWKSVPGGKTRYFDAAMRHITSWWGGEKNDHETGLPHLAHAICCLFFLMWLDDNKVEHESE